jgi:hypothetical protein
MTRIDVDTPRSGAIHARREELLTVKEYAALVRQHPESIRRRIRAGKQKGAERVGGEWRIDVSATS